MDLIETVCDFEHANKLDKLGLKRKSIYFLERRLNSFEDKQFYADTVHEQFLKESCDSESLVNTYTVAELGEMLPRFVDGYELIIRLALNEICYECNGSEKGLTRMLVCSDDLKEANARAKLLIWLIENNHVNVEDL